MFEREIKFIYDFNINKLNNLGSFFSFQQLRESDIHPAIIQYMSAELDYLIFEDRQKLVKDSIFDYSNEKVTKHFSAIGEELKKSKRLSSDYAAKLILHAISFNINFLVRPKWALVKFIFEEESHRSAAEIKQILNYLHFYKYLRKILVTYLNNKKIISLNSAEFIELLNKIDELTIQTSFPDLISSSLKSMGEFFNIGGVQKTKIPFNAVQMFLDEKGLDAHLLRLREIYSDDPNSRLELNDVQKLLTSILVEKIEITAGPEKEEDIMVEESVLFQSTYEKPDVEKPKVFQHMEFEESITIEEKSKNTIDEVIEISRTIPDEDVSEFEDALRTLESKFKAEDKIEIESDEDLVENAFINEEKEEAQEIPVMEDLLENETETAKFNGEVIIENVKESDDDWVFVEEEEHSELIKEITEPDDNDMKKSKPAKKKTSTDDDLSLFNEEEEKSFNDALKEEEQKYEESSELSNSYGETHKDFSKLLEHKNMANIIDVLFDCDIEEVELMLNSISFFSTYTEAEKFIDTYFVKMGVKLDSTEAVTFKKIIRENYNTGR